MVDDAHIASHRFRQSNMREFIYERTDVECENAKAIFHSKSNHK